MALAPLPFRRDLIVSPHVTSTGTVFVVKDPATGRFFRLKEPEYFLAQQLDGVTPLADIQHRVEARFGAALPPETLAQFLATLERLGLLAAAWAAGGHTSRRGRVRGNLLYLRLKVFDPDRLFARLVRTVRCCFTPAFLAGSAALIGLAGLIALANWGELGRELLRLSRAQILLWAWLTLLPITTAHEFAHGITCKRFGGAVHEVGFLLLYLQPAFYCNVSDAWLFPVKAHRLWVTFAGAYCEVCLWAVATLTWRLTEPATALHTAAAVVMATAALRSLLNLNPLIKLDGYYLLSDYLEIPNLRQRAFRYLGATLQRLRGAVRPGGLAVSPRERRIYLMYGLLAGAYSGLLLGVILVQLSRFLIGRYQGVGMLLSTGLLMVVLRQPFKNVLPRPAGLFRPVDRLRRLPRPVKYLLGLALLLAVLCVGRLERKVAGEWTVLPVHNAEVRTQVEGTIAALAVAEGDAVSAGALIAHLDDREARAELRKVEAEIAQQQAQLTMLQTGPRLEEVALARQAVETAKTRQTHSQKRVAEATRLHTERRARAEAAVTKAQERLKYAQSALAMVTVLWDKRAISRKEFEEVEEQAAVRAQELKEVQAERRFVLAEDLAEVHREAALAAQELEEAQGRLRLVLAGSRPEAIAATEAALARLEAQRRYLAEQLDLVQVVSPIAGVITTPKLHEKRGQYVRKGDLIAQVHALQTVTVEMLVAEKEVAEVQRGQPIILKARAYPWQTFYGEVTAVAPIATPDGLGGSGRTVVVTAYLDNTAGLLKPAMTGHAKILCGKRRLMVLLAQWCARTMRVEFWSWG